jgi:hypothetical protein
MKTGSRPKKSKGTWYVSFETQGKFAKLRTTDPFGTSKKLKRSPGQS